MRYREPGFIYFLRGPFGIKIGRTSNPRNRAKIFGVKLPFRTQCLACFPVTDQVNAEKWYHEKFAPYRIDGEWFDVDLADLLQTPSCSVDEEWCYDSDADPADVRSANQWVKHDQDQIFPCTDSWLSAKGSLVARFQALEFDTKARGLRPIIQEFMGTIMAEIQDVKARLRLPENESQRANPSLTRKEAAAWLGIHPKTLADITVDRIQKGKVTGYRSGKRWKYRLEDLDRYRIEHIKSGKTTSRVSEKNIDWGQ